MVMLFTIVSALELNVTRHSGLLEEFYEEFAGILEGFQMDAIGCL